jgi:hypothetical protein
MKREGLVLLAYTPVAVNGLRAVNCSPERLLQSLFSGIVSESWC